MATRYFVEEIKCGMTKGGFACGPIGGTVVVTIRYRKNDGPSQWLANAEFDGLASIFQTDYDPHDILMSEDDEENQNEIAPVNSFEGIEFEDYEDLFDYFAEHGDDPAIPLLRLLIAVTRCDMDETNALMNAAAGKYADEIEIPIIDIEEEF